MGRVVRSVFVCGKVFILVVMIYGYVDDYVSDAEVFCRELVLRVQSINLVVIVMVMIWVPVM